MKPLIIILIILAIFAVIAFLIKRFVIGAARKLPYVGTNSLLTPAELNFFNVLKSAISEELCIMCKVRLADLIKVNRNLPRSESQSAFNRIQSKHDGSANYAERDKCRESVLGMLKLSEMPEY